MTAYVNCKILSLSSFFFLSLPLLFPKRDGALIWEINSPGVKKFYISVPFNRVKGRASFERVSQFSHISVSETEWLVSLGRLWPLPQELKENPGENEGEGLRRRTFFFFFSKNLKEPIGQV